MAHTPMRLHAKLLFYGLDGGTWSDPPTSPAGTPAAAKASALSLRRYADAGVHGDCGWTESPAAYGGGQQWEWGAAWGTEAVRQHAGNGGAGGGLAAIKALWGVGGGDASTDEGSEPKGSESDSMPDTSEGYAASSLTSSPNGSQTSATLGAATPLGSVSAMPFSMQRPPVSMQHAHAAVSMAAVQPDTSTVYASYPVTESYLGAHSFGTEPGTCNMEAGARYHANAYEALGTSGLATTGYGGASDNSAAANGQASQPGPGADGVPSIGSYAHLSGQCSRCCFHPKGRCANGYNCQFCHFDHDKRPRNGKKKRYRRHSDDGGEEME